MIIREQNDEQLGSFVSKKVVFPDFFQDVISTVQNAPWVPWHPLVVRLRIIILFEHSILYYCVR
jgi:hypothetical protein